MDIYSVFLEMKALPKGVMIDRPHDLLPTNFRTSLEIQKIIGSTGERIVFTRLSLKHLAEKEDLGENLFRNINKILHFPDNVYNSSLPNRFLISKQMRVTKGEKPHTVTLEVTAQQGDIIVTSFVGKNKYFKNLKLLWGTAFSPSQ